ncbi:hypothetical protein ACWYXK_21260 [Janthinobacterium lividum]
MQNTFKQIGREFWFPFVCAVSWAVYEYYQSSTDTEKGVAASVKAFGAAFFFVSWLLAQWFRIRKQQKIDGDLSTIERRVGETLTAVQAKTDDLVCHITGGESVCFLDTIDAPDSEGGFSRMAVRHIGEHPLYDVMLHIANIDDYDRRFGNNITFRQYYDNQVAVEVGDLAVKLVKAVRCPLPVKNSRRYNIHFYARNGNFTQQLHFKVTDTGMVRATRILRNDKVVYEDVPKNFAYDPTKGLEWWEEDGPH